MVQDEAIGGSFTAATGALPCVRWSATGDVDAAVVLFREDVEMRLSYINHRDDPRRDSVAPSGRGRY
jgi:hypothetical protein